eukprot:29325-Chlamydomonas_euryale.AAC.1
MCPRCPTATTPECAPAAQASARTSRRPCPDHARRVPGAPGAPPLGGLARVLRRAVVVEVDEVGAGRGGGLLTRGARCVTRDVGMGNECGACTA